jgi:hypothetical protein
MTKKLVRYSKVVYICSTKPKYMKHTTLSQLAETLFTKLNSVSHIASPEFSALELSQDQTLPQEKRLAYYELYEYLKNDY